MKRYVVAALMSGLGSLSAQAADLAARPYVKAPVAPVAYLSWNKCYVGVSGGYTTTAGTRSTTISPNDADFLLSQTLGNVPTSQGSDPDGGIIGGTVGCNWQIGTMVLGGETDLSWTSQKSTSRTMLGAFDVVTANTSELQALGTVRGRLGFAMGPTLFYATGGLAYGYVKDSASIIPNAVGIGLGGAQLAGAQSEWRAGWTVGGGVEHLISPDWSVKAEYLYYDLGRSSLLVSSFAGTPESGTFSHRNDGHIIRVGINYQFGGGAVVAKY